MAERAADNDSRQAERIEMVRTIGAHAAIAADETGVAEIDPRILEVMGAVPRHRFVPDALVDFAYADMPLPVSQEQSIAQPYLVALMTHLARIAPDDIVFETGTGAGYHAAVLSKLARRVVSVEVVAPLALEASARLKRLGYDNIEVLASDGYYGAPRKAPFDAMIIKEAVDHVPPVLLRQLKPGGRMVLPLGPRDGPQYLTVIEKTAHGETRSARILPVRFTPLQGGERI
jgi:protein-L-isoaspartate(D-aspartate) O-methyltransferase